MMTTEKRIVASVAISVETGAANGAVAATRSVTAIANRDASRYKATRIRDVSSVPVITHRGVNRSGATETHAASSGKATAARASSSGKATSDRDVSNMKVTAETAAAIRTVIVATDAETTIAQWST